ncbi:MAG TPA: transcription-repair coupling factor [Candidatus Baltobacteraceae bacterium]|nr:transcription-repair coupling factor [Candidatus Baltobacteraceae bacterium]
MTTTLVPNAPARRSLAGALLHALPASSRAFAGAAATLRRGAGAFALHETIPAVRAPLLAALYREAGGQLFTVVPTADVAERLFADLLYYLEEDEPRSVRLLRSREETVGAIESPSERSARMALLAELADGSPGIILAPLGALRQYVTPRAVFQSLRFTLRVNEDAGWDETLARLYRLGYRRCDVVSAAGEYAVRGGIIDLFSPTAETPTRVEFFGDRVESIRPFELASQRSESASDSVEIIPWTEIPRDDALRALVASRFTGPANVAQALRAYLASGADIPEPWLSLAFEERETLLDYLSPRASIVLHEPAMLATIERALDEERSREESVLLAGVESGELSVRDDDVGEALLADVSAPYPRLNDLARALAKHASVIFPGGIESAHALDWLPQANASGVLASQPADHFNRQIELFTQSLREWTAAGETVVLVTSGAGRTGDIVRAAGLDVSTGPLALRRAQGGSIPHHDNAVFVDHGSIEAGFTIPDLRLRVLGDREIYGQPAKRVKMRAVKEGVPVTLADLKVGDYVVQAVHGIGQYLGLRTETILGATQDYLDLQYAGTDRMLVPVTQMHQVTKYSAGEGGAPRLSKMGGADWARTKSRVSESLAKIAEGLVELYAERELAKGHPFAVDTPWQAELEEAFPYDETPDQMKAIVDTKSDMERARPMDRVVCGDVGYGKTEVAIRAAFKAIADKKQVAILVPTTLLADQHYRNFSARFAGFPIRIEELSRFKSKKDQKAVVRDLAEGKVDIVIGTHRLLQKDIAFADLGLIIVDEEQRFGVMHKERLKQLRASVDVLTLSATPIPRTLHMSLMGVRDLSLIQTAPKNRMSIKTVVVPASDAVVQRAIIAELDRSGQVYYLHNRIESIYSVKNALQQLVPRARIAVGHGQMHEHELEPIMQSFIDGDIDVLVATTIIENGIDIPNVNTIVVNDADKFGLAQLYQLRGRVGRSNHQAYAFLLYQAHKALTEEAKARLEAIREFTHLGSGLQIAMRDLEIRGAGNLLGSAQSGFIASVGFDTYCQLLAEAIAQRRGQQAALEEQREAVIDVKIDAYVPNDYIPQVSQKIAVYQQLAKSRSEAEVEEIAAGVRDRFGPLPKPLENLVEVTKLRTIALHKHVTRVVVDEKRLTLGVGSGFELQPSAIPKFQSLTRNRFRFGEGKILVDLPPLRPNQHAEEIWMPLLRSLLLAM